MKLRTRLVAPVVAILLLLGSAAFTVVYLTAREDAVQRAQAERASIASRDAALVIHEIEEFQGIATLLAESKSGSDTAYGLADDRVKRVLINHGFTSLARRYSMDPFDSVSAIDAHGQETVRFVGGVESTNLSDRRNHSQGFGFRWAQDHPTEPPAVHVRGSGDEASLVFAAPVTDTRSRFAGVIRVEIRIEELREHVGLADTTALYLLDGTRLGSGALAEPLDPALVQAMLTEGSAVSSGDATVTAGEFAAELFSQEARTGVFVASSADTKSVTTLVAATIAPLAIGLALTGALASAIAWIVVARATRPLGEITAAVSAVGHGAFATRTRATGADEFVELAQGVNAMAEQLGARDDALQREAESRARSEKFATLGSLSAGVAHEVNNPLAFMRASSELALGSIDERLAQPSVGAPERETLESVREDLERNLAGIDRVAKIVKSLRLLAKPQPTRDHVSLAAVVDAAVAITDSRLRELEGLVLDVPEDAVVIGSPDAIGQVLLNLVLNASDAVEETGGRVWVRIEPGPRDRVLLVVEDEGPGVPPHARSSIFAPFFTTKSTGTGLGLAISARIMEEHAGSLRYEDRPGGGARFVMDFPAPTSPEARTMLAEAATAGATPG